MSIEVIKIEEECLLSNKPISNKLKIKEKYKVLLVNEPHGYRVLLSTLPSNATLLSSANELVDLIQVFVTSKRELENQLGKLKAILTPKGLLWVTYPKGASKVTTNLNRENIRAYEKTIGLEAVTRFR